MDDLISRRAAIDAIDKRFDDVPMELTMEILQLRRDLRELPSVQRNGRWYSIGNTGLAACKCGYITDRYSVYNYCPQCGAFMKGEEDEESL